MKLPKGFSLLMLKADIHDPAGGFRRHFVLSDRRCNIPAEKKQHAKRDPRLRRRSAQVAAARWLSKGIARDAGWRTKRCTPGFGTLVRTGPACFNERQHSVTMRDSGIGDEDGDFYGNLEMELATAKKIKVVRLNCRKFVYCFRNVCASQDWIQNSSIV